MMIIKTQEEIQKIKEGGKILAEIVDELIVLTKPGASTADLDAYAEKRMLDAGGFPAFKGYHPSFSSTPFASTVCTSINQEIVHAPAVPGRILKEGDILGIDIGLKYKGMFTDMARTVPVGKISEEARNLLLTTQESLNRAIATLKVGSTLFEIGKAVQELAEKRGYGVVRDLVGHGVGKEIHEDPNIPNHKTNQAKKIKIQKGMVIAIEPMLTLGSEEIILADDNWTYETADGSLSAQFEHTIAINWDGTVEVLTPTKWRMI